MSESNEKAEVITREPTPMTLLERAISANMDVDKLEKLMHLQERHMAKQALSAYTTALNECQKHLPLIVKQAENSHTRSKYALLENIIHAVKPVLTQFGFSLAFSEGDCPKENMMRILLDVMHVAGHSQQYHLDVPIDGKGAKGGSVMNEVQGKGSSFHYGQRYLICAVFNLVIAGMDLDGNDKKVEEISEEQINLIDELIALCNDLGDATAKNRLLTWLKVENIANIPASRFNECSTALKATLTNLEKKATGKI